MQGRLGLLGRGSVGWDQVRILQRGGENAVVPQAEITSAYEVRNDVAVVLVLSCRDIVEFKLPLGKAGLARRARS